MSRPLKRLSARTVATLTKPGRHNDGEGLYLTVNAAGAKSWLFLFRWEGKLKEMGLGGISTVSLAEARDKAAEARKLVKAGTNPIKAKEVAAAAKAAPEAVPTFGKFADDLVEDIKAGFRNAKHQAQWSTTLKTHAASLQLVEAGGRVRFASEVESLGFSITETVKREPHVLTPSERKEQDAYDKRRERARRRPWDDSWEMPPRFQEWDYRPTGQLAIELEQVWGEVRPRSTFRDGKTQRFETFASDVAVAAAVLAAAKIENRLRQEAKERKRQEERDRRDHGLRAEHIQERRIAAFGTILTELEKLDRMRQLVAALNSELASSETARVANFVSWANDRLTELEAAISAATLEEKFEEARLFGDDDDYKFVSPPFYSY